MKTIWAVALVLADDDGNMAMSVTMGMGTEEGVKALAFAKAAVDYPTYTVYDSISTGGDLADV